MIYLDESGKVIKRITTDFVDKILFGKNYYLITGMEVIPNYFKRS